MKVIGVIPARYRSSRFPGKPLVELLGKPMIIHVCEIVEKAMGRENTFVATDDRRIAKVVKNHGYNVKMTSESCKTGTDRVWEFAKKVEAEVYVNVQGDEPLLDYRDIQNVARSKQTNPNYIINCYTTLGPGESPEDINIPKVVVSKENKLIYMSRLAIPGIKGTKIPEYKKQVCIYGFSFNDLKIFGEQKEKGSVEKFEDIEILRFFDLGKEVQMIRTKRASLAVDVPEDVQKVETELRAAQDA